MQGPVTSPRKQAPALSPQENAGASCFEQGRPSQESYSVKSQPREMPQQEGPRGGAQTLPLVSSWQSGTRAGTIFGPTCFWLRLDWVVWLSRRIVDADLCRQQPVAQQATHPFLVAACSKGHVGARHFPVCCAAVCTFRHHVMATAPACGQHKQTLHVRGALQRASVNRAAGNTPPPGESLQRSHSGSAGPCSFRHPAAWQPLPKGSIMSRCLESAAVRSFVYACVATHLGGSALQWPPRHDGQQALCGACRAQSLRRDPDILSGMPQALPG